MNARCYKIVFSKRLGARVAVGEHASNQGKATGASASAANNSHCSDAWMGSFLGALSSTFALVSLVLATPAWAQPAANALPNGGQVVQGSVQFNTHAQQLNIHQATDRAAVNWQSFDIGAAAKVNVVQPSAQSVLLNRVGGTAPSQIFGQLSANGRVILVNPNGMVFGKDGSVSAAAFTGSTLNISDADFMAGNERYTRGSATGAIVNRGLIQAAPGGYVALLGASVSNEGRIVAPQGDVYLAAADAVTMRANAVALPIGQSGRIKLELSPASINAAVANQKGGTIVTEGGQVYLQAAAVNAALATIIQSGSIDTTGEQGGAVHVLADGGHIRVDGSIQANSTNGTAGGHIYIGRDKDTNVLAAVGDASGAKLESKGGFVETSGQFLKVDGIQVKAKEWLLDPNDIVIGNAATTDGSLTAAQAANGESQILASDVSNALTAGTNVIIATSDSATGGNGDITVNAAVSNNAAGNTLTLNAGRHVVLNSSITASNISLNAATGSVSGSGALTTSGMLTLNSATVGTLSSNISGAGGLTKTGAGTQILTGANTYSGTTTISSGTLQVGNGGAAGTLGSGNVVNNGILSINRNDTLSVPFVLSNSISGTGALLQSGVGTTKLMGASSTFSGGITISKGNVMVGNGGAATPNYNRATGSGAITLGDANTGAENIGLYLDRGHGPSIISTPLANAINVTNNGTGIVTLGGVSTSTSGAGWTSFGSTINLNKNINLSDGTGDRTSLDGLITGTGHITLVSGRSIMASSSQNTWTGNYTVNTGTVLQMNSDRALSVNNNLINNGSVRLNGGANVHINALTGSGNINLQNLGVSGNSTLHIGGGNGDGVFTGTLTQSSGVLSLVKNGSGTQTLSGANTYTGTTTISGGNLQIGNAGTTGTLGSGLVINNAMLTFNRSNGMTVANAISGSGGLTQSGGGITTLTSANTFTGTTLVSGGSLALGHVNALQNSTLDTGTSGAQQVTFTAAGANTYNIGALQGADDLAAGANSISTGANNASTTYSGVLSGTGNFSKVGNGTQILSGNNNYSGTTTVSGGTLQIGNGGGTGSLGVGAVSLINNSTLRFVRNVDTVLTNAVSGSGHLSATITGAGSDFDLGANVNLTNEGSAINLNVAGAITQSNGSVAATNLFLTAGENIGAANKRIETSVGSLALHSAGDQFLTEANNVIVSARTTGNGNIDIRTTNGTLNVGSFNGVTGITAGGTGNISLTGNTASGNGLNLSSDVSASNGNVTLSGTTSSSGTAAAPASGVYSFARVSANNITMTATAAGSSGHVLGYYGAGGQFIASGALTLSGTSDSGSGNGFYSFTGAMSAGTGITINGTSNNGQGVGLDANVSLTNASGNIVITGEAKGSNTQAIALRGSSITNNGGSIRLIASKGNVFTNSVNGVGGNWGVEAPGAPLLNSLTSNGTGSVEIFAGTLAADAGAIDGKAMTIHQNANGGVLVKTAGLGNVTAPKVTNAGTGDVQVAAGAVLSAGDGSGGQVLTVVGNTISQTHATTPGNTYVYSGRVIGTGVLSRLGSYFNTLHYNGSTHDLNAAFGSAFGTTMMGESSTQVLFRETISSAPGFALNLAGANLSKIYGAADPDVLVGLATAYAGPAMLTSTVAGVGGNHVFGLAAADALASLTGVRTAGENASATPYAYSLMAGLNTSVSGQAGLLINKKTLSAALQGTVTKEYDGTAAANLTNNHFALTGWVGTEGATVSQAAGSYASKNVADNTGAGVVTADLAAEHFTPTGSTLLSNYTLPTSASGNEGTITRAPLTVKVGNTAMFVTQDPNAAFDPGITYEGLKNGETPADVLGALSRTYTGGANPAVGSYTGVYRTATTPSADNYTVNWQWGNLNVVAADKLLIQVGGRSQTYGAVTAANAGHTTAAQGLSAQYCVGGVNCNTISTLTLNDVGSGNWRATDTLGSTILFSTSVNTSGQTSAAGFLNVGNHSYAVGSWSVQGGQNFTDMVLAGGALTVTPKALSLSAHGMSKAYDGTNALASTSLMPEGVMAGDDVGVVSSGGSFTSKLAGQQSFSLSGLQLQGADKANYSFASGLVTGTGSITPKLLSASFGALDKVYDGNTSASLTEGSLSGLIAGDQVSIGGASAAFADPNVARDANGQVIAKSVLIGDVSLAGADAGNYQVVASVGNARIKPKALTATVQADDKLYEGSTSAVVMASTAGVVGGDAVGVAWGSASFASKNVVRNAIGEVVNQTVSVSGMQLTGAQAGNYELTSTSATDQAKISPMLLLPSAAVSDKVYDGQVDALFSGLGGGVLVQGDDVRFVADGARFASPDVARNAQGQVMAQEVTVSGLRLQGPDAGNYGLQGNVNQFKTVASILPRPLSIDAKALDKVYDGTTLATVQWTGVSGWVGAERLGVSALAKFDSPDAGPGKPVSVLYTLDRGVNGAKASNYNLVSPTLKASILTGQGVKPVQPVVVPDSGSTSSSVIQFVSSPVAAVGEKLVQTPEQDLTNNCLQDGLNSCDCEETLISEVQACFTPRHKLSPLVTPSNHSSSSKNL